MSKIDSSLTIFREVPELGPILTVLEKEVQDFTFFQIVAFHGKKIIFLQILEPYFSRCLVVIHLLSIIVHIQVKLIKLEGKYTASEKTV